MKMEDYLLGIFCIDLRTVDSSLSNKKCLPVPLSYLTQLPNSEQENSDYSALYYNFMQLDNRLQIGFVNFEKLFKNILGIDYDVILPVFYIEGKPIHEALGEDKYIPVNMEGPWLEYFSNFLVPVYGSNMIPEREYSNLINYRDYFNLNKNEISNNSVLNAESFIEQDKEINETNNQSTENIYEKLKEVIDSENTVVTNITDVEEKNTQNEFLNKTLYNTEPEKKIDLGLENLNTKPNESFEFFASSIINVSTEEDKPKFKGLGELPDKVEFSKDSKSEDKYARKVLNKGKIPLNVSFS